MSEGVLDDDALSLDERMSPIAELLFSSIFSGNILEVKVILGTIRHRSSNILTTVDYTDNLYDDILNVENSDGWTPLMLSVSHGYHDIVSLLLSHYNNADWEGAYGDTAMLIAVRKDDPSSATLAFLLSIRDIFDIDVCRPNGFGETPLIEAARIGNRRSVELLLDAGADKDWRNDDGESAYTVACIHDHNDLFPLLKSCSLIDYSIPINIDYSIPTDDSGALKCVPPTPSMFPFYMYYSIIGDLSGMLLVIDVPSNESNVAITIVNSSRPFCRQSVCTVPYDSMEAYFDFRENEVLSPLSIGSSSGLPFDVNNNFVIRLQQIAELNNMSPCIPTLIVAGDVRFLTQATNNCVAVGAIYKRMRESWLGANSFPRDRLPLHFSVKTTTELSIIDTLVMFSYIVPRAMHDPFLVSCLHILAIAIFGPSSDLMSQLIHTDRPLCSSLHSELLPHHNDAVIIYITATMTSDGNNSSGNIVIVQKMIQAAILRYRLVPISQDKLSLCIDEMKSSISKCENSLENVVVLVADALSMMPSQPGWLSKHDSLLSRVTPCDLRTAAFSSLNDSAMLVEIFASNTKPDLSSSETADTGVHDFQIDRNMQLELNNASPHSGVALTHFESTSSMADIRIVVLVGSSNDADQIGLAALTAGVVINGGGGSFTSDIIAQKLRQLGVKMSLTIGKETVTYHVEAPVTSLSPTLNLLVEVLTKPLFSWIDYIRIREKLIDSAGGRDGEISNDNIDSNIISSVLAVIIFGTNHPYSAPSHGYSQSLLSMPLASVTEYYRTYYIPNNVYVWITGGSLSLANSFALSLKHGLVKDGYIQANSKISPARIDRPLIRSASPLGLQLTLITRAEEDIHLASKLTFGWSLGSLSRFHCDWMTLWMYTGWLQQHLRQSLVLRRGLAEVVTVTLEGGGPLNVDVPLPCEKSAISSPIRICQCQNIWLFQIDIYGVTLPNISFVIRWLRWELSNIINRTFSVDEISMIQRESLSHLQSLMDSQSVSQGLIIDRWWYDKVTVQDTPELMRHHVNTVGYNDIENVVAAYVKSSLLHLSGVVLVSGDSEDIDCVRTSLFQMKDNKSNITPYYVARKNDLLLPLEDGLIGAEQVEVSAINVVDVNSVWEVVESPEGILQQTNSKIVSPNSTWLPSMPSGWWAVGAIAFGLGLISLSRPKL